MYAVQDPFAPQMPRPVTHLPMVFSTDQLRDSTSVIRVDADGALIQYTRLPFDADRLANEDAAIGVTITAESRHATRDTETAENQLLERNRRQIATIQALSALLEEARELLDLRKRGVRNVVARIDTALSA
jgi:hypothetical protein